MSGGWGRSLPSRRLNRLDVTFFFQNHQHAMTKMHPIADSFLFFAQAAAPAPAASRIFGSGLLFPLLLIVGMYFLMIAPQRKKAKEQAKMLAAIQSGDDVLTSSGIFGTITNVKDDRFVVRIGDDTKIEIAKGFVQSVLKKSGDENK
jgi:preprotein translocase subunit YajC